MDWGKPLFDYRYDSRNLFSQLVSIEAYKEAALNLVLPPDWREKLDRLNRVRAVYGTTALEGNPFTIPEIQTLLDGITVGGRKISDAEQVLNQKNSFLLLFHLVESGEFLLSPKIACDLQQIVAKG